MIKNIFHFIKKNKIILLIIIFSLFLNYIFKWVPQGKEISLKEMKSKFKNRLIQKFEYTERRDITNLVYYLVEARDVNNILYKTKILEPEGYQIIDEFKKYNPKGYEYKKEFYYFLLFINQFPILSFFIKIIRLIYPIFLCYNIFLLISLKLNNNMKKKTLVSSSQKSQFTFKDIAGNEEEKEEMKELIDFLKNPRKYEKIGASIPKGVLLEGPPGTGKTLLAKAVAGEAEVPFFAVSGSEFVEKYVGVGASRVRGLFKEAKYHVPCVIFIDEIDTIGGKRGLEVGSSKERDSTLNQLLTEMDGFNSYKGVIIIGATNRADMLDEALLRPGRFDRKFNVGLPDVTAREAILKVHARNKKISHDIDFNQLAKQTPGMSGAELASILNEASILTIRNKKDVITQEELYEAVDRVLMGPSKKSKKYNEKEKKMIAYHEAGHAVISLKLKYAPKVQKVTIIPRNNVGSYNLMFPEKEIFFSSKNKTIANIIYLLGGRIAEELIFNDISNGAYEDFKAANQIATKMVIKYETKSLNILTNTYSPKQQFNIIEIQKIIDECITEARIIIKENKILLDKITNLLLEKETLRKEEIQNLV
ncbi:MAG: ATP-dependent zinc metalloprotease FtsH [Phytoplasma sp.]|uniref:ATP-dependent zinc metalloprotease FtsH n=1 Tax=Phytoplasma sp. TaxID=2155 RepID=UPI002B409609|nr:ATP-dependent zinc metalloprotease FtsH [Phytoplasma sp.]WRH06836.1 MAG: ATP-dependent zinc metalloprotease FtsH [Phytoplasma sp.]